MAGTLTSSDLKGISLSYSALKSSTDVKTLGIQKRHKSRVHFTSKKWHFRWRGTKLQKQRLNNNWSNYLLLKKNLLLKDGQVTGTLSEEIISILPPTVKWLCHSGAGYDNMDVEACTPRGPSSYPNCSSQKLFPVLNRWFDDQESKCLKIQTVTRAQSLISKSAS